MLVAGQRTWRFVHLLPRGCRVRRALLDALHLDANLGYLHLSTRRAAVDVRKLDSIAFDEQVFFLAVGCRRSESVASVDLAIETDWR